MATHATQDVIPVRRRFRARPGVLAGLVASVAALLLAPVSPAHAAGPYTYAMAQHIGSRLTICAQDLDVRHSRGGAGFNQLHSGQTFTVEGVDGEFGSEWVYGFAYGNVNARGYVQNGWFC
ncbi:hypothetical protein NX801_17045 [Streptomyces sp. LP05-1]|uniref:SH3 domain-containing protein n=1 Tax=Streptomyces pyxinae TaxID=2970734 RepID=A0ABT2CIU9_9ACTN|nr:hypothetical protein [Streptomyces sp. LP05-1]MCS0637340.1 hypothetical protein [Streptomyces sp. LP05-1]